MTTDLAIVGTTDLEALDPSSREAALTVYLTGARDWLAKAVDLTGPETIASAKAEIATAAEAAKQLGLSKEIQLDAQEMVRRAEYALGKAIRKGQDEGTVASVSSSAIERRAREAGRDAICLPKPHNFAPKHELTGNSGTEGIYALSDDITPSEFDEVLSEARAEGNLSRTNVARKALAFKGNDLSVQTACGIDNSFAEGLRFVRSWLNTLTTAPTPEQAEALAVVLRRNLKKLERNLP